MIKSDKFPNHLNRVKKEILNLKNSKKYGLNCLLVPHTLNSIGFPKWQENLKRRESQERIFKKSSSI